MKNSMRANGIPSALEPASRVPVNSGSEHHHDPFSKRAENFRNTSEDEKTKGLGLPDTEGARWYSAAELMEFDAMSDKDRLIGTNRFLGRGCSMVLIGESGIGKSSLAMQAALMWSAGESFFGVPVVRPLRILLIQRENDRGDLAEAFRGVFTKVLASPADRKLAEKNLSICHETQRSGVEFVAWLKREIVTKKAELVICDNFMSFFDGDISKQQDVGTFCRRYIQPVLEETRAALMFVHHTAKPPRDVQMGASMDARALKYYGMGSSELTNWPRAVAVLRQMNGSACFQFAIPKRGNRSGLKDPDGNTTDTIYLKHAEDGLYWVRATRMDDLMKANPGKKKPGRPTKHSVQDLVKILTDGGDMSANQFEAKAIGAGISRAAYFQLRRDAIAEGIIVKRNGLFSVAGSEMEVPLKPLGS